MKNPVTVELRVGNKGVILIVNGVCVRGKQPVGDSKLLYSCVVDAELLHSTVCSLVECPPLDEKP